jgi:hypothetical protein
MRPFMIVLLPVLFSLSLAGQDAEAQKKFAGTWEAKWKDKVVCTITLKAGVQITGETIACNIHVDANGDLEEPESTSSGGTPAPILNAKLQGDTLTFQEEGDGEVIKFEMKLLGGGRAELKILDAPVLIKPIRFDRK